MFPDISSPSTRDSNRGGATFPFPGCEQHGEHPNKVRVSESGRDDLFGLRHRRLRAAQMAEGFVE